MSTTKFVILATSGLTTDLLYEALNRHGVVEALILEEKEPARIKIKRRLKKLPFFSVLGQLFFLVFLSPLLSRLARKRIQELITVAGYGRNEKKAACISVSTVNDAMVVEQIKKYNPDFVFVNGTRIIRKEILEKINVPVLNIHVGITPAYRGIHGGYWALFNGDAAHFGVTLHRVDAGVDTGEIIAQQTIVPSEKDSFASYPVLQFLVGLKLAEEYFTTGKNLPSQQAALPSKQYYHPGFVQYLFSRWFRGIR